MDKQKEQEILEYYLKVRNLAETGRVFNVDRTRTVRRIVTEAGINIVHPQNRTKFNQHFFDAIDSEEKAYWLGFWFADGYVAKSSNKMELTLKLADKYHLERFNKVIKCELQIKSDSYRARFIIANKHLKKTFIKHGCKPNKSCILEFPDSIPVHLTHHFIRGYFDGDGCVGVYKTKQYNTYNKSSLRVSLIGTKSILSKILFYSNLESRISNSPRWDQRINFFQLSGTSAYNFLTYIYKDATIFLERKHELYNFAVQSINGLDYNCGIKQEGCDIAQSLEKIQCNVCNEYKFRNQYYKHHKQCKTCISNKNKLRGAS